MLSSATTTTQWREPSLQHNVRLAKTAAVILLISALLAMATSAGGRDGVRQCARRGARSAASPASPEHDATLQASDSDYSLTAETGADGEFHFDAVPLGKYTVTVEAAGFAPQEQVLLVVSGSAPILHYQLAIAASTGKGHRYGVARGPGSGVAPQGHRHRSKADLALRGRGCEQQLQDHHRFCSRSLHGARSTPRPRRTSGDMGDRWRARSEYQHCLQPWAAVQSQGCLLPAGRDRQLRGRVRRPDLRRL